jgi:hypothetical protein
MLWFIIKPSCWLTSLVIYNLGRSIFIPVFWFVSLWVRDFLSFIPVCWLGILRVINLSWRVYWRMDVFKEISFVYNLLGK